MKAHLARPILCLLIGCLASVGWGVLVNPAIAGDCSVWLEREVATGGRVDSTAIAVDAADRTFLASTTGGQLRVQWLALGGEIDVPVPVVGTQDSVSLLSTTVGLVYLLYAETEGDGEIRLANNQGGSFSNVISVTDNSVEDSLPQMVLRNNKPHVVWEQATGGGGSSVMYWREDLPAPIVAYTDGEAPTVAVEGETIHVVFSRNDRLFHGEIVNGTPMAADPINGATSVTTGSATMLTQSDGGLLVAFESRGSLQLSQRAAGLEVFFVPRTLDSGFVASPKLRRSQAGGVVLTYVNGGDVLIFDGTTFGSSVTVTTTSDNETIPSATVDRFGNVHSFFGRGTGGIFGTNACVPRADFTVSAIGGAAPLAVQFTDVSQNNIVLRQWDFGDGGLSAQTHPQHTFVDVGSFTVVLRVIGPGALEDTMQRVVQVEAPIFTLEIPDQQVLPGQSEVWFPIDVAHSVEIQGFQLLVQYDPSVLTFLRNETAQTAVAALTPEFHETSERVGLVQVGCIFDFLEPIDGRALSAGFNRFTHLVFGVDADAVPGTTTEVAVVQESILSDLQTSLIVEGFSAFGVLDSAEVRVRSLTPEPKLFLRGDANDDSTINIADSVFLLNWLFSGGEEPPCVHAADVQDRGKVDISDPIFLLNYLFQGGESPAQPHPVRGLDPTSNPTLGPECLAN